MRNRAELARCCGGSGMIGNRNGRSLECVVIDVNTQHDFCDVHGAFPVSNLRELIPNLRRVIAWTKRNCAPMVSAVESHRPFELSDSGNPICCIDGSGGQQKLDFTKLDRRAMVEVDNTLSIPLDLFKTYQQIIFRKRTADLLANPKADSLLTSLPVYEFVVFGSGVEDSVKAIVLALLAREKKVVVVTDACGYWHRPTAELALRQMAAKGATLLTVEELRQRKLDRRLRRRWRPIHENGNGSNGSGSNGNGSNGSNGNGHSGGPKGENGAGKRPSGNGRHTPVVSPQDFTDEFERG